MKSERDLLLNALFDNTPEPIILADRERRIIDVNPAFQQMFGFAPGDVRGQRTDFLYADCQQYLKVGELMLSQSSKDVSSVLYFRYRRQDGSFFPARTLAIKLLDEEGNLHGLVGIVNDMSDLDEAPEHADHVITQIGNSERALLDALFEKMPGILHQVDESMKIQRVSQEWLQRFGYTASEVLGRSIFDFMKAECAVRSKATSHELWQKGKRQRVPYTFLTKAGEDCEVELSATLDTSSNTRMALVRLEDVTERNRVLHALEDKNVQLREFARVTAHDLRAPLRHIRLFSEMIVEELEHGRSEAIVDLASDIQISATRLTDMVKGLLDFSLATQARVGKQACDLGEIARSAVRTLAQDALEIETCISIGDMVEAECDPILMERVFDNVLNNALKYVASGKVPSVQVSSWTEEKSVRIAIADNGIGVAEEFKDRIFEPMRRLHGADSPYPGCGIGLAFCQRIIQAHGGRIWVEGSESGSTFQIRLPDAAIDQSPLENHISNVTVLRASA